MNNMCNNDNRGNNDIGRQCCNNDIRGDDATVTAQMATVRGVTLDSVYGFERPSC
jgi:hypothetical protein